MSPAPALRGTGTLCPDSDSRRTSTQAFFFLRPSSLCQEFGKAFQALSPSGLQALEIPGGLSRSLYDARPQNLFRFATLFGKGQAVQRLKERS
jgi:hypothetical protein